MKKLLLAGFCAFSLPLMAQTQSALDTTTLKVWGNCGMCRNTIEKAARIDGVSEARWSTKTKMLTLVYDKKKTAPAKVAQSIARSGYDTEQFRGDDKAYENLHECCKYKRR